MCTFVHKQHLVSFPDPQYGIGGLTEGLGMRLEQHSSMSEEWKSM